MTYIWKCWHSQNATSKRIDRFCLSSTISAARNQLKFSGERNDCNLLLYLTTKPTYWRFHTVFENFGGCAIVRLPPLVEGLSTMLINLRASDCTVLIKQIPPFVPHKGNNHIISCLYTLQIHMLKSHFFAFQYIMTAYVSEVRTILVLWVCLSSLEIH